MTWHASWLPGLLVLAMLHPAWSQDAVEVTLDDASPAVEAADEPTAASDEPATADEPIGEIDLGQAEVLGQRSLAALIGPGHSLTVLDAEQLAAADNLARALETVAGVDVLRQGGEGQLQTLQVRGARSNQVLVLLDGAPLSGGPVDLALIPVEALERVEVLRGPEAARFGPGALGGVVNLVTRRPAHPVDQPPAETPLPLKEHLEEAWPSSASAGNGHLQLTVGSFGLWGAQAAWERPGVLAGFALTQAANDYTFQRTGGGLGRRENNEASAVSAWGAWDSAGWAYRATVSHNQRGVPGSAEFPTRLAELEQLGVWLQGSDTAQRWDLSYLDTSFHDPAPYLNRGPLASSSAWVHGAYAWGAYAGPGQPWGIRPRWDYLQATGSGMRQRFGFDAMRQWRVAHGADTFNFEAGLVASEGVGVDPVGRLGWQRQLGSTALVYAAAAYAVRHPSFEELYYVDTGGVQGNPDLKPERVASGEIGTVLAGRHAQSELALFYSSYQDSILWVPVSAYLVRAENSGRATIAGAELSADFDLSSGWQAATAYTYLAQAELANGLPLPGRARHHLSQRLEYACGDWHTGLSMDYTGTLPADLFGNLRIKPRWLTGLSLDRSWSRSGISLLVDNLFDVSTRDSWNYPLPGRSFTLTWRTDL